MNLAVRVDGFGTREALCLALHSRTDSLVCVGRHWRLTLLQKVLSRGGVVVPAPGGHGALIGRSPG
jgi:hypothetical protein